MQLLGKVLILLFLGTNLFSAEAVISKKSVLMGERVVLILRASGEDIKFPEISEVGGFDIISTGMQQNINYINGNLNKQVEKHYAFVPTKSIDIKGYEVIVDGKKELTNALHVSVEIANIKNSLFSLEMIVKKENVMQFEAVEIEFRFKRDEKVDVRELRFSPPKFENFWVKEGKKSKSKSKDGIATHSMNYFVFPQKAGDFELAPSRVDIGVMSQSRDIFNMLRNQLNWKTVFSNSQKLHVEELKGTNLYGNFKLDLSADKKSINENEGVNVILKITGTGNFDDIEAFSLDIENANIYADKPVVKNYANEDTLDGEFIQKFSISAGKDFIIPAITLTYFDSKLRKLVTKKTKPVAIKVNSVQKEKDIQVKPTQEIIVTQSTNNYIQASVAFLAGVVLTILIGIIIYFMKNKTYKLPKFKSDKELLKALLKYRGKDKEVDLHIEILEENLYANKNQKLDMKAIKKIIKSYEE